VTVAGAAPADEAPPRDARPAPGAPPATILRPRELTPRAVLAGCGIGALLAAGNVYTGLKTSFIDGGSITAAIAGFAFFATFRRLGRGSYSALENNITQTTAASAAVMGFVLGTAGPLPALALTGRGDLPGWQLCLWGIALGLLGILLGAALREKLIVREALPFPTGAATAEVIETIHAARESALRRARLLLGAALAAMYVTWFRDGSPSLIPQMLALPISVGGLSAAALTLGVSGSPLLAATGIFMGLRGAASMLLGAAITWTVVAPWLVHQRIVETASYSGFVTWLVWPGLGLMMGSTLALLALDWRSALRSLRDLGSLVGARRRGHAGAGVRAGGGDDAPLPFQRAIALACVVAVVAVGRSAFGLHPAIPLLALGLSIVLAGVSARAAGETDIAPIGSVGMVAQLLFGGHGAGASIFAGAVSSGDASQTAQTLWALKAGQRLGASARAQLGAQIVGAAVGALVVVPVYFLIIRTYTLGSEAMPATSALSWQAAAEAVRGGFAAMPRFAPAAGAIGLALGVALALVGRTRLGRFAPSPTALGMAVLMPASLSVTAFAGAAAAALIRRRWPSVSENSLAAIAAGGIAGESLMGVLVAMLIAAGLL